MQLDHRQSAAILTFPRTPARRSASAERRGGNLDNGRAANLALMLIVFALAGLWLAFPPTQLSGASPRNVPIETVAR
jgi:hypothetical protein